MKRRDILAAMAATVASTFPVYAHQQPPFELPEDYLPRLVKINAGLPVGEIHVFPNQFRLYLTLPDDQALRYTVGVGRPGLYHEGQFTVGAKRKWPNWRPTPEMIARDPGAYARYADGMPGGIDNPLGARAL
ncbi:MAG: L,D-transpeptidase, partial [Paracoccaceae bacterium]|nr:L,D-transpeptidase [Paracoccaceae bacterium]